MSYAKVYDPLQAGTIDGDASHGIPHDHAIVRAQHAIFRPPSKHVTCSNPLKTLFISRLNLDTTEASVQKLFEEYGKLTKVTLVYNYVTGLSEGYGFVTFDRTYAAQDAYRDAHRRILDDHRILVDYEHGRTKKGWIPRRLGGGFGGKKESGQLRFGGRDCPFRSSSSSSSSRDNRRSSSDRKEHGMERKRHEPSYHHSPETSSSKSSFSRHRSPSSMQHRRRQHRPHSETSFRQTSTKDHHKRDAHSSRHHHHHHYR
ncbi:hypothetical protein BCR42DRAFT_42682 [Absidia repens]|uniref:RRM domain-containing protein n=1 Tax=Absidia repens TaxID=90262 RepID=A0A1X2IFV5_9FUNG|nr:hypothetical protein BCR42DRAFT_42682 [Absidia repens]